MYELYILFPTAPIILGSHHSFFVFFTLDKNFPRGGQSQEADTFPQTTPSHCNWPVRDVWSFLKTLRHSPVRIQTQNLPFPILTPYRLRPYGPQIETYEICLYRQLLILQILTIPRQSFNVINKNIELYY